MAVRSVAMVSVHTSPLATPGGKKTGGMNVYIRALSRELGRRGIAVDIFTRADRPGVAAVIRPETGVRVIQVPAGPLKTLGPDDLPPYLPAFTQEVQAFVAAEGARYDLIFSHYWLSGVVAQTLRAAWDTPVVQMFHTLGQMKGRIARGAVERQLRLRVATEGAIMTWADRLIAATPAERAQMLWLYRADPRAIAVVPPGVDLERFRPLPQREARTRLGVPPRVPLLLFVGRIEPLKGVDVLLRAVALLGQWAPALAREVRVLVIGGESERVAPAAEMAELLALRAELGLDKQVQFIGAREQDDLPDYYSAAHALIMPSDYESFGMVALEAMACGTPVIASEIGGLAFLIQDGINGFHVPTREPRALAERIRQSVQQPDQYAAVRAAARATAEQYGWPAIADRLLAVFEDVLARRAQTSRRLKDARPG